MANNKKTATGATCGSKRGADAECLCTRYPSEAAIWPRAVAKLPLPKLTQAVSVMPSALSIVLMQQLGGKKRMTLACRRMPKSEPSFRTHGTTQIERLSKAMITG